MCCLAVKPDGVCGSPPMVSGWSGFGVSKQNRKFLKSFLVPTYNFLKPLKPLQPLTTIGDCLCWQWGFAMEWFLGLCKTFLCTAINFTLQIGIASHDSYGQTN